MNVIITISSLLPQSGGTSRTSTQLCAALAPLGVKVDLLSLDYGLRHGTPLLPRSDLVTTHLLPCHYSRPLRLIWAPQYRRALATRARQLAPALIHDNGVWQTTNHAAARVARQLDIPLIISPRGMLEPWAMQYKSWKKAPAWHLYQQRDLRTARVLHATSDMEALSLRALGLRQPIAVIPNGVETPPDAGTEKPRTGPRTALFLARVHPVKGLLNLVKAWSQLRPSGWRAVIAGPDEGGHRAEVEAAVQAAGLAGQFLFAGPVEGRAKWDLFHGADLFVLPTFSENFGVAIAEALACGVPVITTKGAPWQVLRSHQCGWWVEIGAEPLAEALQAAMGLPEAERRAMGHRGRGLVAQHYLWPGVAARMLEVYRWMLGRGSRPDCVVLN